MYVERITTNHARHLSTRTLTRRGAVFGLGATGAAALLGAARSAPFWGPAASVAARQENSYPELQIIGREYSFEQPAEIAGGFTRVTLVNEGEMDHHAILLQLADGVTPDDIVAAAESPDPAQLLMLGQVLGGPNGAAPGGGSASVVMELPAGNYELICAIPDEDGTPHYMLGMIAPLTVTEPAAELAAPEADLNVSLVDFEFHDLPAELPAGPQVWAAVNEGQEPHELALIKLAPDVDLETALGFFLGEMPLGDAAMAASPEGEMMAPPFASYPGTAPMNPGMTNWLELDLEPGNYGAICLVPSPANDGAPHVALGMAMPFTVA